MHSRCVENGLVASKDTVRHLLSILDHNGIDRRRRLQRRRYREVGPNFSWYIDCYGKLKPYGICISGCIDGFSRKIIWQQAHHTSTDLRVIAGYFIESVVNEAGCPRRVRADQGTENVMVRDLQTFRSWNHQDGLADEKSFAYRQRVANQRIKAWWSILRKECAQFWMNTISVLKDSGDFTRNFIDKKRFNSASWQ